MPRTMSGPRWGWGLCALAVVLGAAAIAEQPVIRADKARLEKAALMLGVSTDLANLAGSASYIQNGRRSQVWLAKPHDGDWRTAKELAATFQPGVAPAFVAFNRVVFALEDNAGPNDAARLVRALAPLADAPTPRPGRSVFVVETGGALEAFELADRLAHTRGVRFAHPDGLAAVTLDGQTTGAGSGSEIRVMFEGASIADGALADFGDALQGESVETVLTIINDGGSTLVLGTPSIDGDFEVADGFTSSNLLAGQSTTLRLRMDTDQVGSVSGSLSFLNNDDDENPFDLALEGEVQAAAGPAEIQVTLDGVSLFNEQTVGFGSTPTGVAVERTFRIVNLGGAPLSVGEVSAPSGFTVTTQPQTPVLSGQFTEFRVRMNALVEGSPTGDLAFLNNDSDENPFELLITGTVADGEGGAQMQVLVDDQTVANGGLLNFGQADWYMPVTKNIELRNTGAETLRLLFLSIPPGYSLRNFPLTEIPASESTFLEITLDAETGGPFQGTLSFLTNTQNIGEYNITLSGSVTEPPPTGGIDDLEFFRQWHHLNDGYQNGVPGYDLRTVEAWQTTLGKGVTIGVLDSGVQLEHPELRERIVGEFLNNFDYDASFFGAGASHGTAVAGLFGAEANFYGGRGTAPEAGIFATSIYNSHADMAAAIYAAADAGAAVHTNSWGFTDPTFLPDVVRDAVQDLAVNGRDGLGVCFFFSAGNDARPIVWRSALACLPETITVGSLTNEGRRSAYSNVGPWLDVVAPGSGGTVGLMTTDITGASGYNQQQSHITGDSAYGFGGTSASTPLVAGVGALILSVNPDLHAEQVRRILRHTAQREVIVGEDRRFQLPQRFSDSGGYGLVDAGAAVAAAVSSVDSVDAPGLTWPAPASDVAVARIPGGNQISWTNPDPEDPSTEYAGALLIAYSAQLHWIPEDGVTYEEFVGDFAASGVKILARGDINTFLHADATPVQKYAYAVYTYNAANRYAFAALAHANPREPVQIFFDNMESGENPGWTFGPPDDELPGGEPPGDVIGEWARGQPDTLSIELEGLFDCNGALCDPEILWGSPIPFPEAIAAFNYPFSGFNVLATDLDGVYTPSSNHFAVSPVIDLTDLGYGSYSLSFRELLDVEGAPFDFASLRVIDESTGATIRTLLNRHQALTYDWREQWFDLRNQRGRRVRLVFQLQSDLANQFKGWIIDDVRVGASVYTPPPGNRPQRIYLPGYGIPVAEDASAAGGDLNHDDVIDIDDLTTLLDRWGQTRDLSSFSFDTDLDGDGRIGVGDLILLLQLAGFQDSGLPGIKRRGM